MPFNQTAAFCIRATTTNTTTTSCFKRVGLKVKISDGKFAGSFFSFLFVLVFLRCLGVILEDYTTTKRLMHRIA